jgi:SAM-dependent methyltransferase
MPDPVSESVRSLYEAYPFPAPLASALPPALEGWCNYTFLHARTMNAWRDPGGRRILDAGCGTGESLWPLFVNNPGARLTGWDLSQASLDVARAKLDAIGGEDVEFARVDLLEPPEVEPFDLIFCTGVLHHTGDPPRALRNLVARLAPDGFMVLMLYATVARAEIARGEKILGLLGGRDPLPKKVEMARRFFAGLPEGHPLRDANRIGQDFSTYHARDEHLVDTFFHPKAVTYTVEEIFDLLDGAELELVRFFNEEAFDLGTVIRDEACRKRTVFLSRRQKYHLADLIEPRGDYSFIVRRRGWAPPPRPTDLSAVVPMRSPVCTRVERVPLVPNPHVGRQPMLEVAGFATARYRLDAETEAVLELCDGERTVREICERLGDVGPLIAALEERGIVLYR